MAKFILQGSPATPSTVEYKNELARLLRLPATEAEAIVAETAAHLQDRVDDLVGEGMSCQEADRLATAEFGNPRRYARRLTDGFFASQSAFRASQAGRIVLCAAFGFLFALVILGGPFVDTIFTYGLGKLILPLFFGTPALILICAFCARRSQSKIIAVFGLGLTLVTFASTGYYMTRLPNQQLADRREARSQALSSRTHHDEFARELRLLDVGAAAYADGNDSTPIPAELQDGSLFVVPAAIAGSAATGIATGYRPLQSAFLEMVPKPGGVVTWQQSRVASRAEAKLRWKRDATTWRAAKVRELVIGDKETDYYIAAANEPVVFSTHYFNGNDLQPVWITLVLGALDFAGAWMGRRLFLVRRRRRGRGPLKS